MVFYTLVQKLELLCDSVLLNLSGIGAAMVAIIVLTVATSKFGEAIVTSSCYGRGVQWLKLKHWFSELRLKLTRQSRDRWIRQVLRKNQLVDLCAAKEIYWHVATQQVSLLHPQDCRETDKVRAEEFLLAAVPHYFPDNEIRQFLNQMGCEIDLIEPSLFEELEGLLSKRIKFCQPFVQSSTSVAYKVFKV